MPDTSFVVAPIRDHAFFEQAVFQGQVGNAFLQGSGLAAQVMHFAGGRSAGCVSGEAPLAGLHELLRPGVIQALGDPFLAAQLGNAVLAAQAFQHDPDLVFGREVPTRRTPDVLHHPLRGSLGRRFFQGGFGLHLRSFVTTTKPKSSLNHNLNSGPSVLTPDSNLCRRAVAYFHRTSAPTHSGSLAIIFDVSMSSIARASGVSAENIFSCRFPTTGIISLRRPAPFCVRKSVFARLSSLVAWRSR